MNNLLQIAIAIDQLLNTLLGGMSDEKIILQSEHNAIHVVTRPNTIVELTSSD